jgi:hypothetical protein
LEEQPGHILHLPGVHQQAPHYERLRELPASFFKGLQSSSLVIGDYNTSFYVEDVVDCDCRGLRTLFQ